MCRMFLATDRTDTKQIKHKWHRQMMSAISPPAKSAGQTLELVWLNGIQASQKLQEIAGVQSTDVMIQMRGSGEACLV